MVVMPVQRWQQLITDGEGFVANLKDHGVSIGKKDIVIFGAGGAATAILVQCALDGANSVTVINPRDDFFGRAEEMHKKLREETPDCDITLIDLQDIITTKRELLSRATYSRNPITHVQAKIKITSG